MREITYNYNNEQNIIDLVGKEAAEHFMTSRSEYEKIKESIWDIDEEIVIYVPIELFELSTEQKKAERAEIKAFRKLDKKIIKEGKDTEKAANRIIDKGIRDEKQSVRRDISELGRMELRDKLRNIGDKIRFKITHYN